MFKISVIQFSVISILIFNSIDLWAQNNDEENYHLNNVDNMINNHIEHNLYNENNPEIIIETERARIAQERDKEDLYLYERNVICYQRFVVNSCLNESRALNKKALRIIRQDEIKINDFERQYKARLHQERLEEKAQQQEQAKLKATENELASQQRIANAKKQEEEQANQRKAREAQSLKKQQQHANELADQRAKAQAAQEEERRYQKKLEDAAKHREEIQRRIQSNTKRAAPLPAPPDAALVNPN